MARKGVEGTTQGDLDGNRGRNRASCKINEN